MIGHAALLAQSSRLCLFGGGALCVIWRGGMERTKRSMISTYLVKLTWPTGSVQHGCFKGISVKCGLIVIRTHLINKGAAPRMWHDVKWRIKSNPICYGSYFNLYQHNWLCWALLKLFAAQISARKREQQQQKKEKKKVFCSCSVQSGKIICRGFSEVTTRRRRDWVYVLAHSVNTSVTL